MTFSFHLGNKRFLPEFIPLSGGRNDKKGRHEYCGTAHKGNLQRSIVDAVKRVTEDYAKYCADSNKDINPKFKVLLSSGYSINSQESEILDHGCNGFIQKPFKMNYHEN